MATAIGSDSENENDAPVEQLPTPKPKKVMEIGEAALAHSVHAAARQYGVDRHSVRQSKLILPQLKAQLGTKGAPRCKLAGAGRPLKSTTLESQLLEFFREERRNHRRVSRRLLKKKR